MTICRHLCPGFSLWRALRFSKRWAQQVGWPVEWQKYRNANILTEISSHFIMSISFVCLLRAFLRLCWCLTGRNCRELPVAVASSGPIRLHLSNESWLHQMAMLEGHAFVYIYCIIHIYYIYYIIIHIFSFFLLLLLLHFLDLVWINFALHVLGWLSLMAASCYT